MNILENIYAVLFTPNEIFTQLANRKYLVSSFLLILFLSVLGSLGLVGQLQLPIYLIVPIVLLVYLIYLIFWVFESLFITLTADFLGGVGKITDTMIGVSYSMLPFMFLYPASLLPSIGTKILFNTFIYFWSLYLLILSIKETHKISTGKAIWSLVSIIALGVSFVSVIFIIAVTASAIFALNAV